MMALKSGIGREAWQEFVGVCCDLWRPLDCLSSTLCARSSLTRFLAVKRPSGCVKGFSKPKAVPAVPCGGYSSSMVGMRGDGKGRTCLPFEHPRQKSYGRGS